jgi:ERCC4-type nuclease
MESFALVDRTRPAVGEQILIIVDDREVADDMAWELRRKGHPVDVREIQDDEEVRASRVRPPYSIG